MDEGWIKFYRRMSEHWLWQDKPFSKGQAWTDILLQANHSDNKFLLGNELIEVKRGSFVTSELKLMERWGWSKTKVRSFLELLQKDNMIIKNTDRKKTTLTVVNYSDYQDSETTKRPQKDHRETTERPQKDTNKNEKNVKNEKNNKNIGAKPEKTKLEKAIDDFKEFRKKIKKPMTDRAVELLIKNLDKLADNENTKIEILNQSILNGWQSVYPLSNQNQTRNVSKRASPQANFDQREYGEEDYKNFFDNT